MSHPRRPKPMLQAPPASTPWTHFQAALLKHPTWRLSRIFLGPTWLMHCLGEAWPPIGLEVIVRAVCGSLVVAASKTVRILVLW